MKSYPWTAQAFQTEEYFVNGFDTFWRNAVNNVGVWLNTIYNLATKEVHYADCSNERFEKYGKN